MQSADLDCGSDVFQQGRADGFERFKPCYERLECSIPIGVVRVLRKDGEYEILDRIIGPNGRNSVVFDQPVGDP